VVESPCYHKQGKPRPHAAQFLSHRNPLIFRVGNFSEKNLGQNSLLKPLYTHIGSDTQLVRIGARAWPRQSARAEARE